MATKVMTGCGRSVWAPRCCCGDQVSRQTVCLWSGCISDQKLILAAGRENHFLRVWEWRFCAFRPHFISNSHSTPLIFVVVSPCTYDVYMHTYIRTHMNPRRHILHCMSSMFCLFPSYQRILMYIMERVTVTYKRDLVFGCLSFLLLLLKVKTKVQVRTGLWLDRARRVWR